eukprot:m51a1_g5209 putative mannosyl-oligosaccharide -alpha-mannosidase mns2-like (519) ;mRNA; f:239782-242196
MLPRRTPPPQRSRKALVALVALAFVLVAAIQLYGSSAAGPRRNDPGPIPTERPKSSTPNLDAQTPEERADAVRAMMLHAWEGYAGRAWGTDEVKPVTGSPHNWLGLGATIVDSLDTLWLMGLRPEFDRAREWVARSLRFDAAGDVSVFETVIRVVGGLLSAYDLTGDRLFLDKAAACADRLLPAYKTPSGVPYVTLNMRSQSAYNPSWTGGAAILADAGTVQLEFAYLSQHTANPKYRQVSERVLDALKAAPKAHKGLYNIFVDVNSGALRASSPVTLGAMGDSFYEYLVKAWALAGGHRRPADSRRYRELYDEAAEAVAKRLVKKSKPSGLTYLADLEGSSLNHKMDHLACFAAGMFALGARHHEDLGANRGAREHFEIAEGLANTCHEMYARNPTGIGAEYVVFNSDDFAPGASHYILRPEAVEAVFYLWRYTHDEKYREWGWQMFKAIEKQCRTQYGYSGIDNVRASHPNHDNSMPSYFLAETIKYLYLIFAPTDLVPLDKFVFNTEAHPLSMFA